MVSEKIKLIRKKNNLSQADFAKLLGIAQSSVGNWEVGRAMPSIEILIKISDLFDVPTDFILREKSKYFSKQNIQDFKLLHDILGDEANEILEGLTVSKSNEVMFEGEPICDVDNRLMKHLALSMLDVLSLAKNKKTNKNILLFKKD